MKITYRIDAQDRIVATGGDWNHFALANGCETLTPAPLGQSLWSFVGGVETTLLWQQLVERARHGDVVEVPYRCDAPEARRFLTMELSATPDGSVEFVSKLVLVEEREPQAWLSAGSECSDALVVSCSWCRSFSVEEEWVEVEEAVARLGLLEEVPPQISHALCPGCARMLAAELPAGASL